MYHDKIVWITGAAQGLGHALTLAYAQTGAQVIAIDRQHVQFNEPNIHCYVADLQSESELSAVFADACARFGTVHILINNGAISTFNKSLFDITLAEFDAVIAVNLRGSFICAQAFAKANQGQSYGRIINIASTRWNQNQADWEAYGASKGGLVSLTNSLAISLSHTPITVNAISPGWIQVADYELSEIDRSQHPSGRVGVPRDIVNACLFLTHPENDFINGANLVIDGGMSKKMIYANDLWNEV